MIYLNYFWMNYYNNFWMMKFYQNGMAASNQHKSWFKFICCCKIIIHKWHIKMMKTYRMIQAVARMICLCMICLRFTRLLIYGWEFFNKHLPLASMMLSFMMLSLLDIYDGFTLATVIHSITCYVMFIMLCSFDVVLIRCYIHSYCLTLTSS